MPQLLNQWASNSPDSSEKPGLGRVFLCLEKSGVSANRDLLCSGVLQIP